MKTLMNFLFLSFFCLSMTAQTDSILLWPNGVPGLKENSIVEKWIMGNDNVMRVSGVTIPKIYSFVPTKTNKKIPAVIICPGGGYRILSMNAEGFNVAQWFQARGIAAFVLKNRLPADEAFIDKKNAPLQDAQQAILYVRQNAEKYGIDPSKIGIMGFSAGGHLAATASVQYVNPVIDAKPIEVRPDFSILIYPVISFVDSLTHQGSRTRLISHELTGDMSVREMPLNASPGKEIFTNEEELIHHFSAEQNVTKNTPPAFLLHAKDDGSVSVENSIAYHKALQRNRVKSTLVLRETGGHGFGYKPGSKNNDWVNDLEKWLLEKKLYVINMQAY